ncbi:MAG: ASCH domain-containing protein [bacterium]|nr:ASCH domain-containing protein [bacterium]
MAADTMSALSVRQPYAEQIMRGEKQFEYRNQITHKRGRVYIYASKHLVMRKIFTT